MVAEPILFRRRPMDEDTEQTTYRSTNFLKVDMDILHLLNGDWKAACFLAKVLDLQQQSQDGWVYHSWPQWEADFFSRAEVERCVSILTEYGLKTDLRDHNNRLTRHYKVDIDALNESLSTLQESYRVPARKQQHVIKLHPVEKLQGPCEKDTGNPVEKSQCLLGSDLINRSNKTDQEVDANASLVGAANATTTDTAFFSQEICDSEANTKKKPTAHEIDIDPHSKGQRISAYLRDRIKDFKPDAKVPKTAEDLEGWAQQARLMLETDHRDPNRVKAIIDAIANPRASPWWIKQRKYILCMEKLRVQFDFLDEALKEDEQKGRNHGNQSKQSNGRQGPSNYEAQPVNPKIPLY